MIWLFSIDPGESKSGMVHYIEDTGRVNYAAVEDNYVILKHLEDFAPLPNCHVVIEDVVNFGRVVGQTVFSTAQWIGRFTQKWYDLTGREPVFIKRQTVKSIICNSPRANDKDVRRVLIDSFPQTGGNSKEPAIGTKKEPGPLYQVRSHSWSALALCICYKTLYLG